LSKEIIVENTNIEDRKEKVIEKRETSEEHILLNRKDLQYPT
jgi:hypothetical protein